MITHVEHYRLIVLYTAWLCQHLKPLFVHTLVVSIIEANGEHPDRQLQALKAAVDFSVAGLDQRQIGDLFSC